MKKKPIRTHLSEVIVTDPNNSYTSAGIVVDAVKIDAIDNFGTPELVADRVVSMETKKDSVNSAFVHSAKSFVNADLTYYVLDYTVDSSRGVKRYLAKATVTARNLYVFTAQTKAENFDSSTEQVLSKMLQSFTVVKQYT